MATSGLKQARLSWVRGNDVLLKAWLQERCLNSGGREELRPFVIETVDSMHVSLSSLNYNKRSFDLEFARGDDSNEIVIDIQNTIPNGYYSLEITAIVDGRDVRSFESCLLQIVESNQEAKTVLTPIESGHEASVEITIQMVSSAMAKGKNAYELWLDEGNEGSLQDFLDSLGGGGGSSESVPSIITPVDDEPSELEVEAGKYYRLSHIVSTFNVVLPSTQENEKSVKSIGIFFVTGEIPDVTVEAKDGKQVVYDDSYHVEPNKTYELFAHFNGIKWIVRMLLLVGWFVYLSPNDNEVRWVTQETQARYVISSNADWHIS